jgi:hypothetical protein
VPGDRAVDRVLAGGQVDFARGGPIGNCQLEPGELRLVEGQRVRRAFVDVDDLVHAGWHLEVVRLEVEAWPGVHAKRADRLSRRLLVPAAFAPAVLLARADRDKPACHHHETQIPEDDQLGEIEDIESGDSQTLTLDLDAGDYVLFCNIVEEEDGEVESHFAEGMYATFTAT